MKIRHFTVLLIIGLLQRCTGPIPPEQGLVIMDEKLICENCTDFGSRIEASGNNLVVAEANELYLFDRSETPVRLLGTIAYDRISGFQGIWMSGDSLIFGVADEVGTGTVYTFVRNGLIWEEKQSLRIGRSEDNFGSSIDVYGDRMIIGASAPWRDDDILNREEGRVYFYHRQDTTWVLQREFSADQTESDDRFGRTVAIYGDYGYAGSGRSGLHVYEYQNDQWGLREVMDLRSLFMARDQNLIFIRSDNPENDLFPFRIGLDGSLLPLALDLEPDGGDVFGLRGEVVDLQGNTAICTYADGSRAFLLGLEGDRWNTLQELEADEGEAIQFYGLEILGNDLYFGGTDPRNDAIGRVYFRTL